MKILLIIILIPLFFLSFIFGAWIIAVPEGLIQDFIKDSIKSQKIYIKPDGIKKRLFLTLSIEKIDVRNKDETLLLTFNNLNLKPDFISLLKLSPTMLFTGQSHSGTIQGFYGITDNQFNLDGKDIKLDEIPSLKLFHIEGNGNLALRLRIINEQGEIIFNIKDAKLKTTILPGGYLLPLNWFNDIKGLLNVNKGVIEVKSFTLEGNGVYARVKGNITGERIDLKMEIMPDASFKNSALLKLIEPFMASPGYYVIPVNLKGILI